MVIISGQVPTHAIGQDAFQECDSVGITRPCVKHNFLVKDINKIANTIKKAFFIASTGRPGPVLVDIPKDITAETAEFNYPKTIEMRSYNPVIKGHSGQINKAIDLLINAKKPMVYSGGGVVLGNASESLTKFVKRLDFPITNTLMGLGGFPASDKNFLGMLGMHGTYQANMAMQECDVLLAVGARFDDRVIGNPEHFLKNPKKIIHIDIDPASISKRVQIDVPIVGDVNLVLIDFIKAYKEVEKNYDKKLIAPWKDEIKKWIDIDCLAYKDDGSVIKPQLVIQKLHEVTKGDAFVTSDVGQHQMWAAQYYPFNKPRRWINSGGLGTMGVGLPYAMGCQLAFPDSQVACVTGEASIQMCIQELSTCKQFNLPIKVITLNNRYMGMVRQWQEFFYGNRYAESYMDALPDFVKLAESYGHVGMKIEKSSDIESALKEAFSPKLKERLVFMDFITDQTENVFPMIPNGKGLSEMILAEDL
jgi:acetolactate synthase-1/2/3 large subunit